MKTPDEIKKGLGCYIKQHSIGCDDIYCIECELYERNSTYTIAACADALAYIQRLEEDKKTSTRKNLQSAQAAKSSPCYV